MWKVEGWFLFSEYYLSSILPILTDYPQMSQSVLSSQNSTYLNLHFKYKILTHLAACGDVVKKPKLDTHRSRCHGGFDCIDCSTTFNTPAEYKGHTQCISEAEKYQKSLYKGPKTVRFFLPP